MKYNNKLISTIKPDRSEGNSIHFKPILQTYTFNPNTRHQTYVCPICGNVVHAPGIHAGDARCSRCGSWIDWTDFDIWSRGDSNV